MNLWDCISSSCLNEYQIGVILASTDMPLLLESNTPKKFCLSLVTEDTSASLLFALAALRIARP